MKGCLGSNWDSPNAPNLDKLWFVSMNINFKMKVSSSEKKIFTKIGNYWVQMAPNKSCGVNRSTDWLIKFNNWKIFQEKGLLLELMLNLALSMPQKNNWALGVMFFLWWTKQKHLNCFVIINFEETLCNKHKLCK